MRLPRISYDLGELASEIVAMRGINYSDAFQDGDIRDCKNMSARRYPYLSTRRGREQLTQYEGATALTAWNKLVAVQGVDLLYDGTVVGHVSPGEKQFAVINTKMVIWPDKVYLDFTTKTVHNLGASISGTGAVFTEDTITLTGWGNLAALFRVGDSFTVSGCTEEPENNKDAVIKSVTEDTITTTKNAFVAATETAEGMKIERRIPDLDFICESENRLWGCSSATQTIYASALGDPTNFFIYEGLTTDGWAVAVGTEGDFTGCCKLGTSVLFWKENTLHKVLGSFPAEYSVYNYEIEGLQAGCHKSMQVINEVLFYMGIHGVYAYSGGTPSLISRNFGEREFADAVGGNDGDSYYMAVKEGDKSRLFVYETRAGIWMQEDDIYVVDFARIGKNLYFLDGTGKVWLADNRQDDSNLEWFVQFTPFYETIRGRKMYSKLHFRLELPRGSYIVAETRADGMDWRECGKVYGSEETVVRMRVGLTRCDKFELRLHGKGPCTILSLMREFVVGSDV